MSELQFSIDSFLALSGHSSAAAADLGTFGSGSGTTVGDKQQLVFSWLPRERISLLAFPLIFVAPVDF